MSPLDKTPMPVQGVEASEERKLMEVQRTLALVEYVHAHGLAISPIDFVKRTDEVAHKIRHDAGNEWVKGFADIYRRHWETEEGKKEILALDITDEATCAAFVTKLENIRKQLSGKG